MAALPPKDEEDGEERIKRDEGSEEGDNKGREKPGSFETVGEVEVGVDAH